MNARSFILRLRDIAEAIERIRGVLGDVSLETFEADWQRQWLVERGVEIISEASRHLPHELKARHAEMLKPRLAFREIDLCLLKLCVASAIRQ